jgi:GTP-binding protein
VRVDDREFVLADIPGLIEDAHEGAGLGTRFLGHVERTGVLLHLVDATDPNPVKAYRTVRHELEAYGQGLAEKPEIIALSKTDAILPTELTAAKRKLTRATGKVPLVLSSASGTGVREALAALLHIVDAGRVEQAIAQIPLEERTSWHPTDG